MHVKHPFMSFGRKHVRQLAWHELQMYNSFGIIPYGQALTH